MIIKNIHTVILFMLVIISSLAWAQIPPTPDNTRPIDTYFPSSLVCGEATEGQGLPTGLITIGETTLQDLEELYSAYFDVEIEYSKALGKTLVYFRSNDGEVYERVDVCEINGTIVASEGDFPSIDKIESLENESQGVKVPTSFERVGIKQFTARFGIPDVITFSTTPTHRLAFWFEQGVAAEFYIVPDNEIPSAFGSVSKVIYFAFQDVEGYENRWPFNQTYPEEMYISDVAPFVATDVPTVRNPFDFEAIIATITAEPKRTLTPIATDVP